MAAIKPIQVLDASDYDEIQAALTHISHMPGIMAKAKSCGVDCAEHERNFEWASNFLQNLLKTWFPKGRPK